MEKRKARLIKRRQRQLLQLDDPNPPPWPTLVPLLQSEAEIEANWDDALLLINVRYIAFCFIVIYTALIVGVNYMLIRRVVAIN